MPTPRFQIRRFFAVYALLLIAVAAIVLVGFFRFAAIRGIVHLGEKGNVALARTALNSLRAPLLEYLDAVRDAEAQQVRRTPVSARLESAIRAVMVETAVNRIKVYNSRGVVAYSTKREQIGREQADNPGFRSAMAGKIASKLVYRDSFNAFDAVTEDDNLIQTYLPVQRGPDTPIQGVFEVYTDVNALVFEAERTQLLIILIAMVVLLLLYAALVLVVARAGQMIDAQDSIIRERTSTLELLSAKLLTAQDVEKKRVADNLHEGVAQSLAAVKTQLEGAALRFEKKGSKAASEAIHALIPGVQQTIQEVRSLAMDLMPPSLGQLGIEETLSWYERHFHAQFPHVRLETHVRLRGDDLSLSLQVLIFRILQEVLEAAARRGRVNRAKVALEKRKDSIVLAIEDDALPARPDDESADVERRVSHAALQERVALSGGTLEVTTLARGGTSVQITWPA
jgi:signal transduction histidine kinase